MISVPQLLAAIMGVGVALGAGGAMLVMSTSRKKRRRLRLVRLPDAEGKSYAIDPSSPDIRKITKAFRWYSPQFSPKEVPRFYDLSSITENPTAFRDVIDILVSRYSAPSSKPTHVVAFDARGFAIGAPLAVQLGVPLVLLRKSSKNPGILVQSEGYTKEYKEDHDERMCLRIDALKPGDSVILVDDLLATGGTVTAGLELVCNLGATVLEVCCILILSSFNPVSRIRASHDGRFKDVSVFSIIEDSSIPPINCRDPVNWKERRRIIDGERTDFIRSTYNLS
mmetsp:Transcript_42492/g.133841  ORF Transcript_42492/g.133841 Transcript_42492/m.133841 type:complete len:282 (-) Transcript_42492:118-963(-)